MADRLQNNFALTQAIVRNTKVFDLGPGAAVTVTGNTASPATVADFNEALLMINISAFSGTSPTCDFKLQTTDGTNWFDHSVSISQQVSTGSVLASVTNFGEKVRLKWTLGGTTPSFTFTSKLVAKS